MSPAFQSSSETFVHLEERVVICAENILAAITWTCILTVILLYNNRNIILNKDSWVINAGWIVEK